MAKPIEIIPKHKFGRLTIINEAKSHRQPNGKLCRKVLCECECGNEVTVLWYTLRSGRTKSCGCYMREVNGKRIGIESTTHGNTPLGENEYKSLFFVWNTIKQRCYNKNSGKYSAYGEKGIKVCKQWINNFSNFRDWAINNGYYKQPKNTPFKDKLSIDRVDSKGDYTPENCRWITVSQNSSRNRIRKKT
ncbi:MAG TPA: AP2 domain-containing protein [Bacteroidia bacterium]|jgi:hypothetical protein|nr:AP2 domain-containing protein [Bacteroidia bacterium]